GRAPPGRAGENHPTRRLPAFLRLSFARVLSPVSGPSFFSVFRGMSRAPSVYKGISRNHDCGPVPHRREERNVPGQAGPEQTRGQRRGARGAAFVRSARTRGAASTQSALLATGQRPEFGG